MTSAAVLEQWGIQLAVLGMLLAMLFMAAVLKRYQAHQAMVRAAVRRLQQVIDDITQGLAVLSKVPLSRELRTILRAEILASYQRIARLTRRYPGIGERLQAAQTALQAEGEKPPGGVGPIDSEVAFRELLAAIDSLVHVVSAIRTVQPIPADVRAALVRELGERRAEINARFHLVQADGLLRDGDWSRARAHLTTLMHALRQRGPSTDFVRELYSQAESALTKLSNRQLGLDDQGQPDSAAGG